MKFKEAIVWQRGVALAMPCEFPEQCSNRRFFFTVNPAQGVQCGVCLTVNVGEE